MRITQLFAALIWLMTIVPGNAQAGPDPVRLDQLFGALRAAEADEWQVIEDEIRLLWGQSGSPSIDLLLKRGFAALAAKETDAAIEHFTALVENAPNFAEGWNARATAYFNAGLLGPSLDDIRRTLALEPRHFGALAGLGYIFEEMGDEQAALAAFYRVLQIHPHREDIIDSIARLELAIGTFDT